MAKYVNHLIDPSFFYLAVEEFAFDYDAYIVTGQTTDDYGRLTYTFEKQTIRGSLQTDGLTHSHSLSGNLDSNEYKFYCMSLYRIKIGDFIFYKGHWLHCESVHEYDEWGVREASFKMVQLSAYKDLAEYVKYINGDIIV